MHRSFLFLLAFLSLLGLTAVPAGAAPTPTPPALAAKAWLLYDVTANRTLAGEKADERVEPASLTKLMTAYLAFDAVKRKQLSLEQQVSVSETAWKAPGSRMFIEPRRPVTVDELLNGMIIQSGNDASIALAELLGGSEAAFAGRMNQEARRLGLEGTHFMNATGLPDPQHYTTANDLAKLTLALIRDFPDQYSRYAVKEYTYNKITQPNRNRLLWADPTVDGVKTGHTDSAGFCLISSSRRGERRLIAVVLGTDSDRMRAQESLKLLNHGFLAWDALRLYGADQAISTARVFKGSEATVGAGFATPFYVTVPKGAGDRLKAALISQQPLVAPVQKGQVIGTLKLTLDGEPFGEYPVTALSNVPVAGFFGRLADSVRLMFQ